MELYRAATGNVVYLSIGRPQIKYVVKELARRLWKPRKVDMELFKSGGRDLAGRRHAASVSLQGIELDHLLLTPTGGRSCMHARICEHFPIHSTL